MEYTEQQKTEFKAEFSRRRRNQLIATVPMIAAVLGAAFGEGYITQTLGLRMEVFGGIALVVIAAGVIFSLVNWRCPACGRYLGKGMGPNHCPKCGVALRS